MSETSVLTMSASRTLPARRARLVFKPTGNGEHVVKDPLTGRYFNLPIQEAFLFAQLDGQCTLDEIQQRFEREFFDSVSEADIEEFLDLLRSEGFLETEDATPAPMIVAPSISPVQAARSILYWRKRLFDPDRLFNWLTPQISFCWTPAFVVTSAAAILFAGFLMWANRAEYLEYLPDGLSWEIIILGTLILGILTTIHEFAHGMTCKHFGGEVHEVGFLLMMFMPCFYCNVTDAWLFPRKSQRLWVVLAGGYIDLCVWALATFCWRMTLPDTLPYYMSHIIVTVCGGRVFLNLNPLIRLDGYYLLGDGLEIPNLHEQGRESVMARLRWLLWGAPYPEAPEKAWIVLSYGVASWVFSATYLSLMLYGLFHYLNAKTGIYLSALLSLVLAWLIVPGMFRGISAGEIRTMIYQRWTRAAIWSALLIAIALGMYLIPCDDTVSGTFKTRSSVRAEVRAPINGFLKLFKHEEGEQVSSGTLIAVLDIPDLASKWAQKQAEEQEVVSRMKLLQAGNRPEQIAHQKQKVQRAKQWLERAQDDLQRKKSALQEELTRLGRQIAQAQTNLNYNKSAYERARPLAERGALAKDTFFELERQYNVAKDQVAATEAQRRERQTLGTLEHDGELARRAKDLADEQSALNLLEVGPRPEELDAEKARLSRIREELRYLKQIEEKLQVFSPVSGLLITSRLREKVGHYFHEGDVICEIEDLQSLEIEIPLEEQDVGRVAPGMPMLLKPRATPLQSVKAKVERIAPQAVAGKVQSTISVYARLDQSAPELSSNMTGYARITCGRGTLASYLQNRALRYLRTELWW